ncbi:Fe-S cluster assembly protein SufD [Enterococcus nangangensis]|uniref:Fe-S cluster assembly protein SufD n=1 Tax=Enterococcus nangangensis TaxID=2559926 RepID=UPI0010F4C4D0|nr:Fe-S cluster assembly protein SufD [Enterococcus nangangensis]
MVEELNPHLQPVTTFSNILDEPHWFLEKRLAALKTISHLPFPSFQKVRYQKWPLLTIALEETREISGNVPDFSKKDNPVLVQEDGVTTFLQLPQALADQGVIFTDLQDALVQHPELIEKYFMQLAIKPTDDKLTAFHMAFVKNGSVLYVPDNVVISDPIETIFLQNADNYQTFVPHVLIIGGKNSQFTYLERFTTVGTGQKNISANVVVEVIAEAGSQIKYSAVDELGENVTTYFNRRGYLKRDAMVDWAIGVMNNGNVVADFDTDLVGDGAHSEIKVVTISHGQQVQAIDTRVTNKAPHTIGHILQHGVIMDASSLIFNGIGHIIKGAKGSDAQQESRVLMLSDEARGDANPILLIDENEVTAGHAASVGQVDPEEMYYLMSRGLPKKVAERLVIRGFLGPVITAIPVKAVQQEFVAAIEGKLQG